MANGRVDVQMEERAVGMLPDVGNQKVEVSDEGQVRLRAEEP